jgi:protein-S-isoprenylcysteine O-methyltransferase Ste14
MKMLDTRTRLFFRESVLDSAEKYIMATVFIFFAYRMIQGFVASGSPVTLIYLIDQIVVLAFILARRPPKELSVRIDDWILGFAGTLLAILIAPPSGAPLAPAFVLNGLLFTGFVIHLSAKLALRRSFGVVAANRGIKATGVYRVVRHPMYLGYCVSQIGILLAGPTLGNALIVASCWVLFILRINAEERLLLRDEVYRGFAERTRYRILPGVY